MVVRDLAWGDFQQVAENYLALYTEVEEDPDLGISLFPERPTLGAEAEWFAHLVRRVEEGQTVAAVAEVKGAVVGLCTVDRKAPHREARHLGVLGILVARGSRGHGIGRELLEFAIARCRGKFEMIELCLFASNVRARSLYRSVGFRTWGVLPRGVRRGDRYTDLEHMVLDLVDGVPRDGPAAGRPTEGGA